MQFAFDNIPRILLPETDVLVVQEIGKTFGQRHGSQRDGNLEHPYGSEASRARRLLSWTYRRNPMAMPSEPARPTSAP